MPPSHNTSAFMASISITSLIITQGFPHCCPYLHFSSSVPHSPLVVKLWLSQASVFSFYPSQAFSPLHCALFSPHRLGFIMPHERGKPKRGPTYYSQVGRHQCTRPVALSPFPRSNPTHSPHSDQNWDMEAQEEPHSPIPEPNYGGCIVEEEIPPHWVEIPHHLQDAGSEQTTQAGTRSWS
jgi:hypothetical protein